MIARKLIALLLALPLAAGAAALSIRMQPDAAAALAAPLRCDIEIEDFGGSVRLQGVVLSGKAAQGAYEMRVAGPGGGERPDIRQQGEFAASAGRPARLGIVELRKDSGGYNAVLTLIWNGGEYRCGKRIGEAWS